MNLDHDLQRALARKRPGPGFSERVLARLAAGPAAPAPSGARPRRRLVLGLGAGAALAAIVVTGALHQAAERERREGELARQQVMAAFHIAGAKVRLARQELLQFTRERLEVR
jgi:hypothetical protein